MDEEKDVKTMLNEEIGSVLESLSGMAPGGEEYTETVKELSELYRLRNDENAKEGGLLIEESKLEFEREMEKKKFKHEQDVAKQQHLTEVTKIAVSLGMELMTILVWIGMSRSVMKFEQTGTIRSKAWPGLPKLSLKK